MMRKDNLGSLCVDTIILKWISHTYIRLQTEFNRFRIESSAKLM